MMTCPFCHRPVQAFDLEAREGAGSTQRCPHAACKKIVPWEFVHDYATHAPLLFSMIGMTSHGKTTFMNSFKLALEGLGKEWPGFSKSARTVGTFRQGQQTNATRAAVRTDPEFLTLSNVPRVGGCQLLMYDTGGENFNRVENIIQFVDYTLHSQCVVWLIGLVNLVVLPPEADPVEVLHREAGMDVAIHVPPPSLGLDPITEDGKRRILYELGPEKLDEMLRNYRTAVLSQRGNLKNQSLIVVLTKGDYLTQILESFPDAASEFLLNDDLDPRGDAWDRLVNVSDALERWLAEQGYHNFVNNARQYFGAVQFCVSSAYAPNMELRPTPRGVLAPLFWLWRQQRPAVWLESNGQRALYFSIPEALDDAPPGATLRLEAGRYQLREPLVIDRPIHLAGAVEGDSIVEVHVARGDAVLIDTGGAVTLTDLKFEHAGESELQSLVHAPRGKLTAFGCRFLGSVVDRTSRVKAGLLVRNDVVAEISACEFRANQAGLALNQECRGSVVDCVVQQNSNVGIMVRDRAAFRVENCRGMGNGIAVYCTSSVETTVAHCELWKNLVGIKVSAGVARLESNRIRDNSREGIRLEDARAIVLKNVIEKNGRGGMVVAGGSDGAIQENLVIGNNADGMRFKDVARPEVAKNECARNEQAGIVAEGSAAPKCQENWCHHNKGDGIVSRAESRPDLRANNCESNAGHGIRIAEASKAALDRNTCESNTGFGLTVARTSKPSGVRGNTMKHNKKGDKDDQRTMW